MSLNKWDYQVDKGIAAFPFLLFVWMVSISKSNQMGKATPSQIHRLALDLHSQKRLAKIWLQDALLRLDADPAKVEAGDA